MPRRFWTDAERQAVRDRYGKMPTMELAALLKRTERQVYAQATILGLTNPFRWPRETVEAVRQCHAEGLSDVDIGLRLGLTRNQVHGIRYGRLHLPPNEQACVEASRCGVRTQYARLGIRTAGELRALSYRRYAIENGWPEDLRPREVQILNALAGRGVPMSKPELAQAIGANTSERHRTGKRRILLSGHRLQTTDEKLRRCPACGKSHLAKTGRMSLVIADIRISSSEEPAR